ncbi:MAG: hypothetical protein NTY99_01180 [DPANN group archaeon]|nr:hypothetical protein [DPANN group archaeon]
MADDTRMNYEKCISLLNQFFSLLYDERCKPCIEEGLGGCCHGHSPSVINQIENTKIKGWAKKSGIEVENLDRRCAYSGEYGCRISAIKPPVCAAFYCDWNLDNSKEFYLVKKYGISFRQDKVEETLMNIMEGKATEKQIMDFKSNVSSMIDVVKTAKGLEV